MYTTQSCTPDVSPVEGKSRKPSLFANISEGIRMSRARSRVEVLLSEAFVQGGNLKDAAGAFAALDGKRREDVLSFLEKRLKSCSNHTPESETKVQTAKAVSGFLSLISSQLPLDERGNKQNASLERFMPYLIRISEGDSSIRDYFGERARARLSCTQALWDVEFNDTEFWEDRIKDPTTGALAIKLLLEMPPTKDPEAHGWALLREHLSTSAYDIASNPSPKRVDFLMSMLKSGELDKVKAVFDTLLRLDVDFIPRELATLGFEMHLDPTDSAIKSCATEFWLSLQKMVQQKIKAADASSGANGQAVQATENSEPAAETRANVTSGQPRKPEPSDIEVEMGHFISVLNCADDRQFESASQLIARYRMGRGMIGPLLPAVAQEMLEIMEEPAGVDKEERADQQKKAFSVLLKLFNDDALRRTAIQRLLDMPQHDGELSSWAFLKAVFQNHSYEIAASGSSNKTRFLLAMLQDPDDDVVRAALRASVYLDRIPNRMFSKAYGIIQSQRQGLVDDAVVFMEVSLQREELASPGVSRYKAALMILDLHLSGNQHLARMVQSIADGTVSGAPPSVDGDGPTLLVAHLNAAGVKPHGLDIFTQEHLASTVQSLLDMPEADGFRYRAWNLLAANIDALAIPIAESASENRIEFIMSMVRANSPQSIGTALHVAAYLDPVPEGLLALAQDIQKHEEAQILWKPAKALTEVVKLKSGLESGVSRYDYALGLVSLFNDGNQHLGLMLRRLGSDMESISKGADAAEAERARSVLDEIKKTGVMTLTR